MTSRRVLIIEDEMVVQLHLSRIVNELGHEVVGTAADMDEALLLARRETPELVLTDIHLAGGTDGVETARLLVREIGCAVIFITAYADDATVERSQDIGAAGYLVKPFSAPQVKAAISTALANHERRAREREQARWLPSTDQAPPAGVVVEKRPFGAGTRLMLYSHDTFGLGHLRRSMALIRELSGRFPDLSMLLVTGSPMVHRYTMPAGADYVKLPALHKVGADRYEARSLQIPGSDVVALRSSLILNAARDYQPNVLLVDHSPTGGNGELLPTLSWLRERGDCTCILGMRDIVDDPEAVRASWSKNGVYQTLDQHYDHIVVYGHPDYYDLVEAYELPPATAAKSTYIDFVFSGATESNVVDDESPADADPRPSVFVTIGGGDGGCETVILPFLEMMRSFADRIDFRAEIVTGPFVDLRLRDRLDQMAEGLPVVLHEFLSSTRSRMEQAEVVISTAGYNTTTDLLSWARRSILIPRALYREEQRIRARRLHEMGLCTYLDPDAVTPAVLFETIERARQDAPLERARAAGLPLAGASRFCDFCARLEVAVRATEATDQRSEVRQH